MKLFFLSAILFFYSLPLFAAKVTDLYQVELPVSSQSEEARTSAINIGFEQVLIKISGNPSIMNDSMIRSNFKKAETYVQEFSYLPLTHSKSPYLIRIHYNSEDINRLLKNAGVPYWGANRPLILIYLVVTNKGEMPEMIGHEASPSFLDMIGQQSKIYGLPLIFPMMDMTDINQISTNDIMTLTIPSLKEASKRYSPDALLVGHMEEGVTGFQSEWRLMLDHNQWDFAINGQTAQSVIASLMNQMSQTLAGHYVVKTKKATALWLNLEVNQITDPGDLPRLMQYLKQMADVQQIRLNRIVGDVVQLSILVNGSIDTFQQNAEIGERLILKSQDASRNQLVYEWAH